VARKRRPFTRKQRNRIRVRAEREARAEAKAQREEQKEYAQSLDIFKRCDPARTEALADVEA
jgi:hypothetical protein